ncbi:cytochrome P450 705A12-like [Tripterygium wilfordii]|uniref:cytochrome P450 705A12-like n=1 Tax=Tripterygium wilfordii TaxID=458696 RepID=UPI0018F81721|nr:cytochrome P450 705A12-like [Tripterygium wilfordii]
MTTVTDVKYYYLFLFFLWLFSTFLLRYIFKKSTNKDGSNHLPPSPPSLPLVGHIHLLRKEIHLCFQRLAIKYGPLLYLRLGPFKFVLVSSASMATEVFKSHDVAFSSKPTSVFKDRLIFGNIGFVLSPYGDYWRYLKKLTVTELFTAKQLQRSRNVRREELHRYLKKVLEKARGNEVFNVKMELMKMTNNTICRMALSTRCSEEDNEAERVQEVVFGSFELAMKTAIVALAGPLRGIVNWMYGGEEMEMDRKCDELLERMWKEHEERAKRDGVDREDKDLMDIFMEAYHDTKSEFKITKNQIKACILDIFIAGTSTSTDAMQWMMTNLINHPKIFEKAREEIDSVVGNDRLVEETDLPNLPYLQAIVKEALRLYPPGSLLPRKTYKACQLSGYDIPKDIMVVFNLYAIMRDPEAWDNPDEFIPERFLSSNNEKANQIANLLTFGAGRRMCPGSTLALTMMNTTIASMVQCFDWKVGMDGDKVLNTEPKAGFHLSLEEPLQCRPIVRFNPFSS